MVISLNIIYESGASESWLAKKQTLVPAVRIERKLMPTDLVTALQTSRAARSAAVRTDEPRPVEEGLGDNDGEVFEVGEDERPTGRQTRSSEIVDDSEERMSNKCGRHYCVIRATSRK